jgi:excisionase family DNA binding protein
MSALLDRSEKTVVTTTERENAQARELAERLRAKPVDDSITLALKGTAGQPVEAPAELTAILRQVVEAIGQGGTVTIGTLPKELTTTTAAKMLGVSRPTLMQLISKNELPAHKVRSHTRVFTEDVQKYRAARTAARRQGINELRALEDELGVDD